MISRDAQDLSIVWVIDDGKQETDVVVSALNGVVEQMRQSVIHPSLERFLGTVCMTPFGSG